MACFYEFDENHEQAFRVRAVHKNGLLGSWISKDSDRLDCCLPKQFITNGKFFAKEWHKGMQITYDSHTDLVFSRLSFLRLRTRLLNLISQKIYNVSTRFQRDRINILQRLVSLDIADPDSSFSRRREFSRFDVFTDLYGYRAFNHPNYEQEERLFSLLIESLIETGDLEATDYGFKLKGKSLSTILEYEVAERRHRDNQIHNTLIAILTLVLAGSAVATFFY